MSLRVENCEIKYLNGSIRLIRSDSRQGLSREETLKGGEKGAQ